MNNAIRLKIIITITMNHRNQNRQTQRALKNRRGKRKRKKRGGEGGEPQQKTKHILSSVRLTQYGKHKPCFNPDSLIICVQNSIITILF